MTEARCSIQIGLPVYNGEAHIERALASAQRQRRTDWRLHISDNGSKDGTWKVVQRFQSDSRISYVRQPRNLGAMGNFSFLLSQVQTPLFCWLASDDEWDEGFLEDAAAALEEHPDRGTAFTGMVNIADDGRVIRNYPFMPLLAGPPGRQTAARYAAFMEYLGKANIIYGLHRTEACRAAWRGMERIEAFKEKFLDPQRFLWGADMAFGLRLVAGTGLAHSPPVRFRKRIPDHAGGLMPDHFGHRSLPGGADLGDYLFGQLLACWDSTAFGELCAVLERRLVAKPPAAGYRTPLPSLEGPPLDVAATRSSALAPILRLVPGHHLLEWLGHVAAAEVEDLETARRHLRCVADSSPSPKLAAEALRRLDGLAPDADGMPPVRTWRRIFSGR